MEKKEYTQAELDELEEKLDHELDMKRKGNQAKDLLKSNRFSYWIFFLIIFVLLAMIGSLFLDDPGEAAVLFGAGLL